MKKLWDATKSKGENIGLAFLILGCLGILVQLILVLAGLRTEISLLSAALALISVGLGFTAVGMSAKSDKRHTDLLEKVDKNITTLPLLFKGDILTPSGQLVAKDISSEQSKIAAQKRLDEDTKRVGFVRGETHQLEDGRWSIHWGGKYPL